MRYLIANTFPLSLVRRKAVIEPVSIDFVKTELLLSGFVSVWGHENTLPHVNALLGVDLTPSVPHPAAKLNGEKYPVFQGEVCQKVLIISPDLPVGFRPALGQEIGAEMILGWQALLLDFSSAGASIEKI